MEIFEEILTKYNYSKRITKSLLNFEEIERIIKFNLPIDYKIYLQNYLGFEHFIGQEFVRLWSFEELLESNDGYEILENLPKTLGIGTNGSGEFIGIEFIDNGNYRIILSPFIDFNEEYHIEIGSSFTDFLLRLDYGKKWFTE